jgi:hypothetical protein
MGLVSIYQSFPCRDGLNSIDFDHQQRQIPGDLIQVQVDFHGKSQGHVILWDLAGAGRAAGAAGMKKPPDDRGRNGRIDGG